MTKRRDEAMLKLFQRLKENIRMLADLPLDAEMCPKSFKHRMLRAWQDKLASAGDVYDTRSELVQYFSCLEKPSDTPQESCNSRNTIDKDHRGERNTGHYSTKSCPKDSRKHGSGDDARPKSGMWCTFHKAASHSTSDCHTPKRKEKDEHKRMEMQKKLSQKKKQYPRIHNDFAACVQREDEIKFVGLVEKKTRPKRAPLRAPVKLSRGGPTFEALLDSGASKSIINGATLDANVQLGRKLIAVSPTVFETMIRLVTSSGTTMADLVVTHRFEVIKDSGDEMWNECSLVLNTGRNGTTSATDEEVEDQEVEDQDFPDESKEVADSAVEPGHILSDHLKGPLAQRYLKLLVRYRELYDGHLGRMRFDHYKIPITPVFKPVPYAVARSHEAKARDKIQYLVNSDVLEQIYDSEVAAPAFFLVMADGYLRLLVDY
ncbi:hypothetical protein PInf_013274 [Phytophthora infestans]|nr:hypothetical protein PInf_013274 [Phytophthora infestans]